MIQLLVVILVALSIIWAPASTPSFPDRSTGGESTMQTAEVPGSLLAAADSEEDARRIAERYGITLESFHFGLATYTTDKDTAALIKLGKENGWPALEPNHQYQFFTEGDSTK